MKDGQELKGLVGSTVAQTPEGIEFKQDETSEVVVYRAGEVAGYERDGTYYNSYIDPGQGTTRWIFIEIIVQGDLSLFLRNKMYFVLVKGQNSFIHLDNRYKSKFRRLTGGCPFLSAKAWRLRADKQILAQYVKDYNECVGVKNPNYEGMPRKVSVALLAGSDVTMSKFNEDGNDHTKFMTSTKLRDQSALQLGFDITLRNFRSSNVIGLYTGAYYASTVYDELTGVQHTNFEVNQFTVDYKQLKIPFGLEFNKPTKQRLSFHVRIGAVYSMVRDLRSTHSIWEIHDTSGNVFTREPARLIEVTFPIMPSVAVGFDYRTFGNSRIRVQAGFTRGGVNARVEQTTQTSARKDTNLSGSFSAVQLMAGFVF